jgi:hypothetical protein
VRQPGFRRYTIDAKVFCGLSAFQVSTICRSLGSTRGWDRKVTFSRHHDRVTICLPHPVLRRMFQAGGRERRDMIRNSARCNRDEVGGPARNAMCLGIFRRTSVNFLCVSIMFKRAWFVVCATATFAFALDPQRAITQFVHTSWTDKDGAPSNIRALAQTQDGYLWIGTTDGLFRFDGVRFTAF